MSKMDMSFDPLLISQSGHGAELKWASEYAWLLSGWA